MPVDNRYLDAVEVLDFDEELDPDLSDELDDGFSNDFGLAADFSPVLSGDFSDFSGDLSDEELDESPPAPLVELFAASRLSLR